ncbi:MAG TPA: thioesterase family protein [Phycisphaerae bacterium]|nr:acyl-CoA thioesterase [Phycisphaerae bacterium]HOB74499.1 thioesterase family protein [Phycisphaerae bacterium]HOJ54231.1 thioesterase family protein [Phycisphaerae bacterium]HOL26578.1 thioesterase family protein [Phycisphaerae bacterium]HPP20312.1 thioesterase family protein [Phycisphaerae bacterium]
MEPISTATTKPVEVLLRVRYSETDQMGTFYNSRVLEWFECGRTEWLRATGLPYAQMEARGVLLPVVESHVQYLGRARYDDLLRLTVSAAMAGRATLRFDVKITHASSGAAVAAGYTVHAIVDSTGKPMRPPAWFLEAVETGGRTEEKNS